MKSSRIMTVVIVVLSLLVLAGAVGGGWKWGWESARKSIAVDTTIQWLPGPVIHDSISVPVPVEVTEWEERVDTLYLPSTTDTTALFAVWEDYYRKRTYDLDFSNDTLGEFKVRAEVTENRLVSAVSTLHPYIRTVYQTETITKPPRAVQPWLLAGTSVDLRTNQLTLGIDVRQRFLIGVSGVRMDDRWSYTLNVGVKF